MKNQITKEELIKLGQEWQDMYAEQKREWQQRTFKYTTWSIVTREDLTANEKIALCYINAATPVGGIHTGLLQRYLQLSGPTMHRVLKNLIQADEIKHGGKQGLWVVTETEKLF